MMFFLKRNSTHQVLHICKPLLLPSFKKPFMYFLSRELSVSGFRMNGPAKRTFFYRWFLTLSTSHGLFTL